MNGKITDNKKCLTSDEIRDYHLNKLSDEKKRQVEEHIIDCDICSDLFDAYENISDDEVKKITTEINSKIDSKIKHRTSLRTIIYSSAAIIVLFALSVLLKKSGNSGNELFTKYFKPYPDVTLQMRNENNYGLLKKGMQLYNSGKYKEALKVFGKISGQKKNNYAEFYSGVALIAEGKTEKGIQLLKNIAVNPKEYFYPEANWYIGLAYLKLNKPEKAMLRFELIKNNPDFKTKIMKIKGNLNARN